MKPFSQCHQRFFLAFVATLTLLILITAATARAASMAIPNGDVAALIAAVNAANATPEEDTIVLAANGRYVLATPYEAYGQTGLPTVTGPLTIEGNGAAIARDGLAGKLRILLVAPGASLTLTGVTLENGYANYGGAIYNNGLLTVNSCMLTGNRAEYAGGAVFNTGGGTTTIINGTVTGNQSVSGYGGAIVSEEGTLVISHATFTHNRAPANNGGALWLHSFVHDHDETFIDGSTFAYNSSSSDGGAIFNYAADLYITNSTFSGNTVSAGWGGAIANIWYAQTFLTSCSVIDNHAMHAAAVVMDATSTLTLAGTLLAVDHPPDDICHGGTIVAGLDSNLATDASCGVAYMGYGDLHLGPLGDNGSPTLTHGLQPGSRAIDYIPPAAAAGLPDHDQRHLSRPVDADNDGNAFFDVGAFEHEPVLAIDVQPKDPNNIIRLADKHFDVLVKGAAGFDPMALTAAEMAETTVLFGTAGETPAENLTLPNKLAAHQVNNGLLLHFHTADAGFVVTDQEACLTLQLADGRQLRGCDAVAIRK